MYQLLFMRKKRHFYFLLFKLNVHSAVLSFIFEFSCDLTIRCVLRRFFLNGNGRTDGPTDRRTDTTSYRDATAHLKRRNSKTLSGGDREENKRRTRRFRHENRDSLHLLWPSCHVFLRNVNIGQKFVCYKYSLKIYLWFKTNPNSLAQFV